MEPASRKGGAGFLRTWAKRTGLFFGDMRASREATTCTSHGRESVGHATAGVPWPQPNGKTVGWDGNSWLDVGSG